jgi:type I restriction enzyme, R subunit
MGRAIEVVMTGAASEPPAWQAHIGRWPEARRELIAKWAMNPKNSPTIVIVRDMWLIGFDAPCMHTVYVDKPMKGQRLSRPPLVSIVSSVTSPQIWWWTPSRRT